MAFSSLKLNPAAPAPAPLPCVAVRNCPSLTTRARACVQFERSSPKVGLKKSGGNNMSRRDALSCVTSTLLLTSFIQTEPADARIAKPDIRRKIMERLEQLREKAGFKRHEKTTAPKEESKKVPKLENKNVPELENKNVPELENKNGKLPKEEKKLPQVENKDGGKLPMEEKKVPQLENKDGSKMPEEKKEQPKLVEVSS